MKQIFALIVTVLILNPCLAFCQPKAKRAIQRMSKHTTSARAQERAAKEAVLLKQRRAESLAKRQEALELNQLSEQFGLRVQERIIKKNSKENRLRRKEPRRQFKQEQLLQNKDFIIFDIYKGDNLPKGTKSVAIRITIEQKDKTLTDDEINVIFKSAIDKVVKLGGKLRDK